MNSKTSPRLIPAHRGDKIKRVASYRAAINYSTSSSAGAHGREDHMHQASPSVFADEWHSVERAADVSRGWSFMPKMLSAVEAELPRAALIVAHPPHILTLYGWMSKFRPLVHILTDGHSMGHPSAADLLTQTMQSCGATQGEIFCETPEGLYFKALLERDLKFFVEVARTLANSLIRHNITVVVADAEEGYNSIHDVCRAITDAAVDAARKTSEQEIVSYACYQTEWIKADRRQPDTSWLQDQLEPDLFAEKLEAASRFTPWSRAIAEAVDGLGQESFRKECLAPVLDHAPPFYADLPYYEIYGEKRVASGKYARVIRYREHMVPVWEALREFVNEAG